MKKYFSTFSLVFFLALAALPAGAQMAGKSGFAGHAGYAAAPVAAGTNVTVNLGGTAVNTSAGGTDANDALFPLLTPFVTPATMINPSFSDIGIYWSSPDGTNKTWGTSFWSDAVFTGTVNTQNATSGSCTANCILVQSGNNFVTTWSSAQGGNVAINVAGLILQCVIKTTTLAQCTNPPGTQTGVTYTVHTPGTLVCATASLIVATAGWNNPGITTCGTPTVNTWYWVGGVTISATQAFSRLQGNRPCDNITGSTSWGTTLSAFVNVGSWGVIGTQTFATLGTGPGFVGDGCAAIYMKVNYNTTDPYTILSAAAGACDSAGTTCVPVFPPTQAGSQLYVYEESSNTGIPCSTPTDLAGDTFTLIGTPASPITGGSSTHSQCWYRGGSITTGTQQATCNFAAANKQVCATLETKGTVSVDQSCYDPAFSSSSPYTGCSTPSTTQATELVIASMDSGLTGNSGSGWSVGTFTPGSGWTLVLSGSIVGSSPYPFGIFSKIVNSTGAQSLTASNAPSFGGSNQNADAVFTSK